MKEAERLRKRLEYEEEEYAIEHAGFIADLRAVLDRLEALESLAAVKQVYYEAGNEDQRKEAEEMARKFGGGQTVVTIPREPKPEFAIRTEKDGEKRRWFSSAMNLRAISEGIEKSGWKILAVDRLGDTADSVKLSAEVLKPQPGDVLVIRHAVGDAKTNHELVRRCGEIADLTGCRVVVLPDSCSTVIQRHAEEAAKTRVAMLEGMAAELLKANPGKEATDFVLCSQSTATGMTWFFETKEENAKRNEPKYGPSPFREHYAQFLAGDVREAAGLKPPVGDKQYNCFRCNAAPGEMHRHPCVQPSGCEPVVIAMQTAQTGDKVQVLYNGTTRSEEMVMTAGAAVVIGERLKIQRRPDGDVVVPELDCDREFVKFNDVLKSEIEVDRQRLAARKEGGETCGVAVKKLRVRRGEECDADKIVYQWDKAPSIPHVTKFDAIGGPDTKRVAGIKREPVYDGAEFLGVKVTTTDAHGNIVGQMMERKGSLSSADGGPEVTVWPNGEVEAKQPLSPAAKAYFDKLEGKS